MMTTGIAWAQDTERPWAKGYQYGYPKAISPTEIEVRWNPGEDNVTAPENLRYRVWYKKASSTKQFDTGPYLTGETKYTITGLESNTEYLIRVEVRDDANNFSVEPQKRVSTMRDTKAPEPGGYVDGYPKAIQTDKHYDKHIKLKWEPAKDNVTSQGMLRYVVQWRESDTFDKSEVVLTGETEYTITGLSGSNSYVVNIKVMDEAGNYAWYNERTIATPPIIDNTPPQPQGYVSDPKPSSPTSIFVQWYPAKDDLSSHSSMRYWVRWWKTSGNTVPEYSPRVKGAKKYGITGLEPNTEYIVQVGVADEDDNEAYYSEKTVKTPPAPDTEKPKPGDYVDGYPKAISPTEIVVKWNKATDNVTKQEKLRYQVTCGLLKKLVKSSPILTDETEYTITDLDSDITYDISVRVWDEADNLAFYSVKEVKPLAEDPKPEPGPGETVLVSSVTLDLPKVSIDGDRESFQLKASVLPANATNPALQWSSSNPSVASVEAVASTSMGSLLKAGVTGKAVTVRIHKKGKAEITAQAMDGSGKSATCQVEVLSTVGNIEAPATRIYAASGTLRFTLPQAATVHIYNVIGRLVRTLNAPAGNTSVALPQGVYVVKAGNRCEKVRIE